MAAKLTKDVIKGIVKECLIEILAEGLSSGSTSSISTSKKSRTLKEAMSSTPNRQNKRHKMPSYLDDIDKSNADNRGDLRKNEKLQQLATKITDDPVLREMLEDTAQTTLQEQIAADSKKGFAPTGIGDNAQKLVENNNPEDLFGEEASSKWASLAFG